MLQILPPVCVSLEIVLELYHLPNTFSSPIPVVAFSWWCRYLLHVFLPFQSLFFKKFLYWILVTNLFPHSLSWPRSFRIILQFSSVFTRLDCFVSSTNIDMYKFTSLGWSVTSIWNSRWSQDRSMGNSACKRPLTRGLISVTLCFPSFMHSLPSSVFSQLSLPASPS